MKLFSILFFLHFPLIAVSQLHGKVVSISDGDTFTLLADNKQIKVRLYGIDCPEKNQDFGYEAKVYLSGHVLSNTVTVKKLGKDRYGRILGIVTADGENVNESLLKAGLAWHYKAYDNNPTWARMEQTAKNGKKGLWVKTNAISPWKFRKSKRPNS